MNQDLRDAARALRATPLVTGVAILSLALGIGATTAMFSIVDSLILRSLPVANAPQLAMLGMANDGVRTSWTNPIWEEVRNRPQLFDGSFAWSSGRFNLAERGEAKYVEGLWASAAIFDVLGVRPALGRTFTADDDTRGGGSAGAVTVISHGYWQRAFGGRTDVLGKSITLNRVAYTVVGVTPAGFFGPEVGRDFDVIVPLGTEPLVRGTESALDRRSNWWLSIMVKLKPGQTTEMAAAAIGAVQPQIREATIPPQYRPQDAKSYLSETLVLNHADAGTSWLRSRYQRPLVTIMVVVTLVLLIACGNIANLLLARATARKHELSVRQALGASRLRLVRQLLAESVLLSAIGGALGIFIALWGSRLLIRQLSTEISEVYLDVGLDWRMLAFVALATVGTALLFGTAPAITAAKAAPIDALKEHGRDGSSGRAARFGGGLVVAQVALSLILVITAGLFVRTFTTLATRELGFRQDKLLIVGISAGQSTVKASDRARLYERIREQSMQLPGVQSAALSAVTPVSGSTWNTRIWVKGGIELGEKERMAFVNYLSPTWFPTLGTAIIAGRDFDQRDQKGAPRVVIVNQTFAKKFLGTANPLGRIAIQPDGPNQEEQPYEIIGVVADAVYRSLREPVPATAYFPIAQTNEASSSISLTVRLANAAPGALTRSLDETIGRIDRDVSLTFRMLDSQIDAALLQERLVAMLSALFGGLALLLAGLGLYGVTAYSVNRRKNEIGIRMALGAPPGGVMRMILLRVGGYVGLGVAIGAVVSWGAARSIESLLFGLAPRDTATMLGAAVLLGLVGALAGWLPARRAAAIDPARVLRDG